MMSVREPVLTAFLTISSCFCKLGIRAQFSAWCRNRIGRHTRSVISSLNWKLVNVVVSAEAADIPGTEQSFRRRLT